MQEIILRNANEKTAEFQHRAEERRSALQTQTGLRVTKHKIPGYHDGKLGGCSIYSIKIWEEGDLNNFCRCLISRPDSHVLNVCGRCSKIISGINLE